MRRFIELQGDLATTFEHAEACCFQQPTPENVCTLRKLDIRRALTRCRRGELSVDDLQRWAEIIEVHELIDYEPGQETSVADAVFWLSTPEINGALTDDRLAEIEESLLDG